MVDLMKLQFFKTLCQTLLEVSNRVGEKPNLKKKIHSKKNYFFFFFALLAMFPSSRALCRPLEVYFKPARRA
jgi:hypothetical protein